MMCASFSNAARRAALQGSLCVREAKGSCLPASEENGRRHQLSDEPERTLSSDPLAYEKSPARHLV